MKVRCVVLDRDGTLIRHIPYLHDSNHVELLPTVAEGLQTLRRSGVVLLLHTNQSGVGRGYFPYEDAVACNSEMIRQLGMGDDIFARVCIAPEMPSQPPGYRKPSPRFGLEMIEELAIAPGQMCYIGDNPTDLLTARHVGCRALGVNTGPYDLRAALAGHALDASFPVFDTFIDAARHLIDENS